MFQKSSPDITLSQYDTVDHSQEVETVVGPSVHVEGDFSSEGNILVKGTVSGSVKTSRLLTVEKGARIFANVRAGSAFISGEIKGNVKATDKLELTSSARIMGDISCTILAVEAGALLQGKVSMKGITIDSSGVEKKRVARLKEKEDVDFVETE
ncbi:MAG: hypothetical protein COX81_00065 [Candidatus Magasanikbacteria bacterium CG_4_10_14_0_2_um_filter_37_12]|uniref:Cell shape determination protein CcmA n=1 Tax=Candidatus Magasanikbacteria bacterium CG_4_10_14_0_2_um_filter_37_12 TaxID=1974637 RepID=A0A2M7VAG2_9BACT|nr:MAG: hypothetical protein COX81_00065 [Candidatus Magasanikbacteria bacterium CG_4_10_14_0_2_um_filter_37_12]